jgi:hypothetical protein
MAKKLPKNFTYELSLSYSQHSLICCKMLHGTNDFISPPKEVVLLILSPLNIYSSQLGLNPRTSGPMVSMLPLDHRG